MGKRKYPRSVTVRMTNEMYANLRRLATDDRKVANLVREMIRAQLDDRAEIAGSRRFFNARFQDRVDQLENHLIAYLALHAMLLTEFEEMMIQTLEVTEEAGGKTPYPSLFRGSAQDALRYLDDVRLMVEEIVAAMESTENGAFGVEIVMEVTDDEP